MTPTDTLNDAFGRLNVEGAAFTDGHASPVGLGAYTIMEHLR